jgi:LysM repeat protein
MATYTVQSGDTLGTIAAKILGSSSRYKEIAAANPQLTNINVIVPGQVLNLPASSSTALVPVSTAQSSLPPASLASGSLLSQLLGNKKLLIALALGVGLIIFVKTKKRRAVA